MSESELQPLRTEFAFEAKVDCEPPRVIGPAKYGQHQLIPIVGGSFAGPRIRGEVLPGGADWQLIRSDGLIEVEARYTLRADDGGLISVCNCGLVNLRPEHFGDSAQSAPGPYTRTVPKFETAAAGPHAWLNKWLFLGTLRVLSYSPLQVQVGVYRVL